MKSYLILLEILQNSDCSHYCPEFLPLYIGLNVKRNKKKLFFVLFRSLKNCKRRNKGNFTLNLNLNKIMLCGVGRQYYLVLNKISTL